MMDCLKFYMHGELEAEIPAYELVLGGGAPQYEREYKEPAIFRKNKSILIRHTITVPEDLKAIAEKLIQLPNIAIQTMDLYSV